ncbi:MAG: sigma-70 family RNA polymerase sigma factor [Acidobacteriaceae bacterium]|nr:sigma-70 family RNA polymerase sigma factor [Acidobacteriaceae bacterium]
MGNLASAIGVRADETVFVQELKAGSEEAFALLIAQYSHSIYSLIARSLRDPADAADVTQDVFIKVFRHISSFNGDCSLRTWMYRIALREISNKRRWWSRHKRQEMTIDEPRENDEGETSCLADMLAAADASPYDNAARLEIRYRIETSLAAIPDAFREVVILREIEGASYEEIAELLECTIGTVKSRLARGRSALRKALEPSRTSAPNAVHSGKEAA